MSSFCSLPHTIVLLAAVTLAGPLTGAERSGYTVYQPTISVQKFVHPVTGKDISGHDSTITWFRDRWIWQWDDGTEKPGQRIRQTTSPDLKTWTAPIEVYSTPAGCSNPVAETEKSSQWQPGFILVGDELWSFWTHYTLDDGLYVSRLRTPDGKWENTQIIPAKGRIFVGNGGMVASNGRILIPVTHWADPSKPMSSYEDKVVYSDDGGKTWAISSQGVHAPADGWAWEATIWEPTPGKLMMISRNSKLTKGGTPSIKALSYARSDDLGATWKPLERTFLPMEMAVSRPHVLRYGSRHLLAQNDFWTKSSDHNSQRRNLSLFFTRGVDANFTAGTLLLGDSTDINCDYPQIAIKGDQAVVCWTWNRKLMSDRPQMITSITPLPDPERWYVFPRSGLGRSSATVATVDGRSCLRLVNDDSSAGVDLDANRSRTDTVRLTCEVRSESGTDQTILTIGQPAVQVAIADGQVVLRTKGSSVPAGRMDGWTRLTVTSAPDTVTLAVGDGTPVNLAHRLGADGRGVYLGQGYFEDLQPKPGSSLVINVGSLRTEVTEKPD